MRTFSKYLILLAICTLWACQSDEVDFTYLPAEPRAGQTIAFSNLTKEGEEWLWEFGDGGESTLKSPSKIYKKPGTYVITLTADGKAKRKCSKEITVYDTVPTFTAGTDRITYRTAVTFTAVLYNPYNYTVTYAWNLPETAVITAGGVAENSVTAYFVEKETDINVQLTLSMGSTKDTITQTFHIYDSPAPSLLIASDKQLLRQRLYSNGTEDPAPLDLNATALAQTNALLTHDDTLYVLTNNAIYAFDMTNERLATLISSNADEATEGFFAGTLADGQLYWGGHDRLYRIPLSTRNATLTTPSEYLFAEATQLSNMPGGNTTGIDICGNLWLWSTGKGICRFTQADNNATLLLADYPIRSLAVDALARKVYFSSDSKLFVCNIDGTYTRLLAEDATGALAIDNLRNRIYFAQTAGVAYLPLVQTQNNQTTATPLLLNQLTNISALATDNTER